MHSSTIEPLRSEAYERVHQKASHGGDAMDIGHTFRRLTQAFKGARHPAETDSTVGSYFEPESIKWETSADDEVVICEASDPGARLIAAASLCGVVQIRVCPKNMTPEEFRVAFPMAYTYG